MIKIDKIVNIAMRTISVISVTRLTSHCDNTLLKDVACRNVFFMFVTLETFQSDRSPLKLGVFKNIPSIVRTLLVSHASKPRPWKLRQLVNAKLISSTDDTFHRRKFPLKLVTRPTFLWEQMEKKEIRLEAKSNYRKNGKENTNEHKQVRRTHPSDCGNFRDIPIGYITIEDNGTTKHFMHIHNITSLPS